MYKRQVYDRIPEYIKSFSPDERDMTKYIIGTFSALDTPMNPEAKGSRSLSAYLEGITYEQIQKERNEILNAQPEDIRRLADLVEAVSYTHLMIMSSKSKPCPMTITDRLLREPWKTVKQI